jgi:PKD repeat protein
MRKFLIIILFHVLCFPSFSQGWWVFISGTVTDTVNGRPVAGHPVTVMSDSTFGFFYYNIVLTDSTGYYHDELSMMTDSLGILYIQTTDCNGFVHQVTIVCTPANNTFVQDFQICTSNVPCESAFVYYPDPPDSFLFFDLSTGSISGWQWDFGDGTSSNEQNPYHSFPGPGSYTACLTITGIDCSNTYCQEIVISDTVYRQVYGQVFAGNFPLRQGKVMMFAINPVGIYSPLDEGCPVDSNGIYYFTLVPEGIYLIQAIPYDSTGYLPTYYGDATGWLAAVQVIPGQLGDPYNINLVNIPAGSEFYGPGSLEGQINNLSIMRSMAENVNIILLDENLTTLGFSGVSSNGYFEFPTLDYGIYHIRAELAGVHSENMKFEISQEKPDVEVILNYNGNSVLSIEDLVGKDEKISVYPIPASDRLNISASFPFQTLITIELYSMTGQKVFQMDKSISTGEPIINILVNDFPEGIYTLRLSTEKGTIFTEKVILAR